jgi:hypothetical protein
MRKLLILANALIRDRENGPPLPLDHQAPVRQIRPESRCCAPGDRRSSSPACPTSRPGLGRRSRRPALGCLQTELPFVRPRASGTFRRIFLEGLEATFRRGRLGFFGDLAPLADPGAFAERGRALRKSPLVVYAEPPFGGPERVRAISPVPSPIPGSQPSMTRKSRSPKGLSPRRPLPRHAPRPA